jgi:hypothetical protein
MYGDRAIEELNKNSEFQKFGKVWIKKGFIEIEVDDKNVFQQNSFEITNKLDSDRAKTNFNKKKIKICKMFWDLDDNSFQEK